MDHPKKRSALVIDEKVEARDPEDSDDGVEEEVYVAPDGAIEEEAYDDVPLNVMRCLAVSPQEHDWRRTSIFHTHIKSREKLLKLLIDGESGLNAISKAAVASMGLNVEPQ